MLKDVDHGGYEYELDGKEVTPENGKLDYLTVAKLKCDEGYFGYNKDKGSIDFTLQCQGGKTPWGTEPDNIVCKC